jgi:hypothetical protein
VRPASAGFALCVEGAGTGCRVYIGRNARAACSKVPPGSPYWRVPSGLARQVNRRWHTPAAYEPGNKKPRRGAGFVSVVVGGDQLEGSRARAAREHSELAAMLAQAA